MARISYNDNSNVIDGIIQLKTQFNRKSGEKIFNHVQVYHKDDWYIYRISQHNYEVFKERTTNKVQFIDGKMQQSKLVKVKYPNDEDFGKWAWSVNSYDTAINIIRLKS